MKIVDFSSLTTIQLSDAARILREAMPVSSYGAAADSERETSSFISKRERFALAALIDDCVLGWIGGIRSYSHALELHPLVVDPPRQRQGIGRALISALEQRAAAEGYLTVHLGTDDEGGGTTLFGANAFPDALSKLQTIQPSSAGHPFFFYRKLGYEPIGIVPDANGFGKPDLLMAKRVATK